MNAKLFNSEGKVNGTIDLPTEVFGVDVNETLLHGVLKSYLANKRQGTAKTKGRAEVSGGGAKPFKQKGTGRARAGSNTSPLWVRGGKAHGSDPRDYTSVIPKKMRRLALRSAYSARAQEESVLVIEQLSAESPKTSFVDTVLQNMEIKDKKNLLIIGKDNQNIYLSGRNIKNVTVKSINDINALDIIRCENVVFASEKLIDEVKEVVK